MDNYDLDYQAYLLGEEYVSMADLLRWFTSDEHKSGNMSRMSDIHLKVGRPFSYRFDDDIESIPGGADLDAETLDHLVYPLLSEKNRQLLNRVKSKI